MATATALPVRLRPREEDQRVFLEGVSWEMYEKLLELRGERPRPRMIYLEGVLELMTTSWDHEWYKKTLARILEAYADELGLEFTGVGSMTLKVKRKKRGLEPDECYEVGPETKRRPDLAVEVIWTSGGLDKLEVYRGLGIQEVWLWRDQKIEIHALRGDRYVRARKSRVLPGLDLERVAAFLVSGKSQSRIVRDFRASLRGK
ncbi:MAG: Uma2 family endonuclease [Planctomycetes bacterium]|nr:Uma2 family endonuclease [Planctomycetota bacterium]